MWQLCVCILIAGSSVVILAEPITYKDCGSKDGAITEVDIIPCPSQPCVLKHGTNMTVQVKFTPNVQAETLNSVVHGVIAGVPVPFPLPRPNGCQSQSYQCPVEAGTSYLYSNYVYVDPSYPKLKLVIKWELVDQNNKDVVCFLMPATISD